MKPFLLLISRKHLYASIPFHDDEINIYIAVSNRMRSFATIPAWIEMLWTPYFWCFNFFCFCEFQTLEGEKKAMYNGMYALAGELEKIMNLLFLQLDIEEPRRQFSQME